MHWLHQLTDYVGDRCLTVRRGCSGAVVAYIGVMFFCSALLIATFLVMAGMRWQHPLTFAAQLLPEAVLITLPAVMLWPRWRYFHPALLTVVALFFIVNILYLRNFDDLLSISMLRLGSSSFNALVVRSAMASLRPLDVLFVVPVIAAYVAANRLGPHVPPIALRTKIAALLLTIMALFAGQVKHFRDTSRWLTASGQFASNWSLQKRLATYFDSNLTPKDAVGRLGLTAAYLLDAYRAYAIYASIAELQRADMEEIASWQSSPSLGICSSQHKNLLLIVVESLNSRAIEWTCNGRSAMPYLNSLLADTTAISFTSICPQTGKGRSSDGQQAYYSGLYPSQREPMCVVAPNGPFPSLPRQLASWGYTSVEIIFEEPYVWNHQLTNKAFGFDSLYHSLSVSNVPRLAADSLLLQASASIVAQMPEPYFAVVTTIAMHDPYNEVAGQPSLAALGIGQEGDQRDLLYLEYCAAFDRALQQFMARLQASPQWNNTIVAIASDHEARELCLSPAMSDNRIFFALLNSGRQGFHSDGVAGQTDVYPTLIDALGLWDIASWRGFGMSLLRGMPGFALRPDGTIVGDTIGRSDAVARQFRALDLSQRWIRAANLNDILQTVQPNR